MASSNVDIDEPLTPLGRQFVQPQMGLITYSILTCELPLNVSVIRTLLQSSPFFLTHPRLSSILVKRSGREYWHKTALNLEDHLVIRHHPISENPDDDVNEYIADLCATPLSTDKPLWELHLLMSHNTVIFRIHHAVGDGISLVSLLMSMCRRVDEPTQQPSVGMVARAKMQRRRLWSVVWRFLKVVWYALVYVMQFLLRVTFLKDGVNVVRGGDGVDLGRRKVVTATFLMEDMKLVKRAVPKATINDVLLGMVSSGLSKYLEMRSPTDKNYVLVEGLQITGIEMVNLRREEGLQLFTILIHRLLCHTSFTISNVAGPREKISFAGNTIKSYKATISNLPQALVMHFASYAGVAYMQIQVLTDVIPDPKELAKCFEDALMEMKKAATMEIVVQ